MYHFYQLVHDGYIRGVEAGPTNLKYRRNNEFIAINSFLTIEKMVEINITKNELIDILSLIRNRASTTIMSNVPNSNLISAYIKSRKLGIANIDFIISRLERIN